MSGRVYYGLSGISGNPNANFNIDFPNHTTFALNDSLLNNSSISTSNVVQTWDSGNTLTVKTVDPSFELYTAEKVGFARTSDSLVAIANGEVGLELKQNATEIDRLEIASSIIRQYETISLASQNYNISAGSPKTYLIEPGSANTNKIIFNDASLVDGTTYSIYNMSNGSVTVESTLNSEIIQTVNTGFLSASNLAISPDGTKLASTHNASGGAASVQIWDVATLSALVQCTGHTANVLNASFSDDGSLLATSSANNSVRIFDTTTGTQTASYSAGTNQWIQAILFYGNTHTISFGENTTVRIINASTGVQASSQTLTGAGWGWSLALNSTKTRLLTGQANATQNLNLISINPSTYAMSVVVTLTGIHTSNVEAVRFYDNDTKILTVGGTSVRTWSINEPTITALQTVSTFTFTLTRGVLSGNNVFVTDIQCQIHHLNLSDLSTIRVTGLVDVPDNSLTGLHYNNNNIYVARTSTGNGTLIKLPNYLANRTNITFDIPGINFYQNLTTYAISSTTGISSFTIPRYFACHIKVCKISNIEIYFFVNMTVNSQ